ncbi:MAG: MFS transporter [Armatimonadota bacterium]
MSTEVLSNEYLMKKRNQMFLASCIALIATAMTFAIRGDIMGVLGSEFALSKEQIGLIAGTAFWGFTISIFIGGMLCDIFGMKKILAFAFFCHIFGCIVTILANGFGMLFAGTLLIGLANGFVEAAINPLAATIYPDQKTAKLNSLHAWFPGGIVIGGLIAYFFGAKLNLGWQAKMATILVPTFIYGIMFLSLKLPETERVQCDVSTKDMYKEALRPLFILWMICMIMTASTELGTNQWLPTVMTLTTGAAGILILVWINGLMAIGRLFAGPIVHKLSPPGLLIISAIFSAIGLFYMSTANSPISGYISATIFAIGICYFWPTMLGFTSERFPKGGALLLGMMGAVGMLSVAIVLPIMGQINDKNTMASLPAAETKAVLEKAAELELPEAISLLQKTEKTNIKDLPAGEMNAALVRAGDKGISEATDIWNKASAKGGSMSFRVMVVLPIILIIIFSLIYLSDKAKGGYKIERLNGNSE